MERKKASSRISVMGISFRSGRIARLHGKIPKVLSEIAFLCEIAEHTHKPVGQKLSAVDSSERNTSVTVVPLLTCKLFI